MRPQSLWRRRATGAVQLAPCNWRRATASLRLGFTGKASLPIIAALNGGW
jgi:hypothetical protein